MADHRNLPLEQWSPDSDTVRLLRLGHNWNVQSNGVRVQPVESSPTRNGLMNSERVQRSGRWLIAAPVLDRAKWAMKRASWSGIHFSDMGLYKSFRCQVGTWIAVPLGSIQRHKHAAI